MIYHKTIVAYLLFIILIFSSCLDQDTLSDDTALSQVSLSYSVPVSSQTKATQPGVDLNNENQIDNISLYVFADNTPTAILLWSSSQDINSSATTGLRKITIPAAKLPDLIVKRRYVIYVIANATIPGLTENMTTLSSFESQLHQVNFQNAQSSFLMDGKYVSAVVESMPKTLSVNLARAAAKVTLSNLKITIPGAASVQLPQIKMMNYLSKGRIISGNPYTPISADFTDSPIQTMVTNGGLYNSTKPFYCYENDWNGAPSRETWILINVPYQGVSQNFYRIPLNYSVSNQNLPDASVLNKLKRNYFYELSLTIDRKGGGTVEDAVEIAGNYKIKPWATSETNVIISNQHFLFVKDKEMLMPNLTTINVEYQSDLTITIKDIKAEFTAIDASGKITESSYPASDNQFPKVTVQNAVQIKVDAILPFNFVPKRISFTVVGSFNGLPYLQEVVKITQYPAQYITVEASTGKANVEETDPKQTNFNLFTVNSITPGAFRIGDPTEIVNGKVQTRTDEEGNQLVSPKFVVASQKAIVLPKTYANALTRCLEYYEGAYTAGRWRIPTKAELQFIDAIQDNSNSAIKKLLIGSAYWSARTYDYYNFTNNSFSSGDKKTEVSVRCVYDVYKY